MKSLPIWQCRKSGDCCKRFISSGPEIQPSEKHQIIKVLDKPEIRNHLKEIGYTKEGVTEHMEERGTLPLQNADTCAFLRNNECLIHEIKPKVCHEYPLSITTTSTKTRIYVDLDCPRGNDIVATLQNGDIPPWIKSKKPITVKGRYFYEELAQEKFGDEP